MRLHFTLSRNTRPVPFAYQHKLTGVFHRWLESNDLHDKISLYSLSWLTGGRRVRSSLDFARGASWFVSFYEDRHAEKLVSGALSSPEMFCGMQVTQIRQQTVPEFGEKYRFLAASPIFAKGKQSNDGKPPHHYLYNEPAADEILAKTLVHKMDAANKETADFTEEDKRVKVIFDREYEKPRIKLVQIKDINVHASLCPVIVEGTQKAVRFAWNVGIGNGTGSCFGSLL